MWEIYDVSFLLDIWRTALITDLPRVSLDVEFLDADIREHIPYKLIGSNAPLLVAWADREDYGVLDDLHTRSRRSIPQPSEIEAEQESPYCSLKNWHVSFRDLDWDHWIIQPTGYDANFCKGICPEPLNNSMILATNHAYVKSVYRILHEENDILPIAYCVPFQLSPMSLLYDYNGTIHMRHMNEVRATTCGCL